MQTIHRIAPLSSKVFQTLGNFVQWLETYGENSFDHQSFFAGPLGSRAKGLYYHHRWIGTAAVAPMIFCEAFLPTARRWFHHPIRLPISDAHYAMGFALLYEATGNAEHLVKAGHFLDVLKQTRCVGYRDFCWGYPFDWVTRNGVIKKGTPLITTTPYVFEAFQQVNKLEPHAEYVRILESIARHIGNDIKDFKTSQTASMSSYTPHDEGGVVNASAYRAFTLLSAEQLFPGNGWEKVASRNLKFVLDAQKADGSWPYAVDGVRDFVDHFHTCFVMKALAKIYRMNRDERIVSALQRGVHFYLNHLFAADGMPRPFAKAPRLTVYQCELYDCAECINLCLLLRELFPELEATLERVVAQIMDAWIKPDGSFRSRKLIFGWDNVPMHRWAQSQMFRALAFYLREHTQSRETSVLNPISTINRTSYVRDLRPA